MVNQEELYFTVMDLAKRWNVSEATVRKWISGGRLKKVSVKTNPFLKRAPILIEKSEAIRFEKSVAGDQGAA